ncbi:GNAT family N-acetyltransferase [Actinoplanes sp. NPDC000266]
MELRLPDQDELAELARLAGKGVHRAGERPFLTPWTEGSAEDRARAVLKGHWGALASWRPDDWEIGFGVFRGGEPIGLVGLRAVDFAVVREVKTWSWLGLEHQGQGYGTEARVGLLTLAFDHLGARAALTEVFQDNHSSQGVSRKLGYVRDGISVDARDGEALVSDRLRLTRDGWRGQARPPVVVEGVPACLEMLGLSG